MGHAFLSESWFDEVEKLRDAAGDIPVPEGVKDLKINFVVTGGPDGDVEAHINGGQFERGLADAAPTKLTIPYDVARKLLIERDGAAAMQAFMSGQIQVEGDMSKLMAMQGAGQPSEQQSKLEEQMRAITE